MLKTFRLFLILGIPVVLLFFSDCQKDKFSSGPLTFSRDTLTFDTVFTTLGSTTQSFTIHNNSKYAVNINSIQLVQSAGNQFRINVDGLPGNQTNVQIPGHDSLYVFAEVTVHPNNTNTPFVLYANVNFTLGNKTQTVVLQAFGQNAHFHYGQEISAGHTENWANDKPHVIVSNGPIPGVLVDCGATLNIQPGCKIFMGPGAALFVEGTLNAMANSWDDSIIFRGVRLESYYQDLPGQWFGIVFLRDSPSLCTAVGHFSHCVVNESQYGIYVGAGLTSRISDFQNQSGMPTVTIDKTIISNAQYNAIYGFNGNITATNSLFFTAGDDLIKLGLGGIYNFSNCTMYNVSTLTINHQQPTLLLSNYAVDGNYTTYPAPLTTSFNNCVIYGDLNNEIAFNNLDSPNIARFNNTFSNCLLKTPYDTLKMLTNGDFNNIFNQDPRFKNPANNDFTPSDSAGYFSPLIDFSPSGLDRDLLDHMRPVSLTGNINKYDIGAVEAQH